MIHIHKDYTAVPEILRSQDVKEALDKILTNGKLANFPKLEWLMHTEVLQALLEIYHRKCAYCEQSVSLKNSSVFIKHYRPTLLYGWLVYEWSNLLPVCRSCSLYIDDRHFPLENEHLYRIKEAPKNRQDWLANAPIMLQEDPLQLNPEIDTPSDLITFDTEGCLQALNKNYRGSITIKNYNLNQGDIVIRRRKKIDDFFLQFERAVNLYKRLDVENTPSDKAMNEYFVHVFDELSEAGRPEAEFSLLGKNMLERFSYFFVDRVYKPKDRRILFNAYEKYMRAKQPDWKKPVKVTQKEKKKQQTIILQAIQAKNIKCFGDISLRFPKPETAGNMTLVVGTNGNGKSTILQLLALGLTGLHRPPVRYGWSDVIKTNSDKASFSIFLEAFGESLSFDFEIDAHDSIICTTHPQHYEFLRSQLLVLGYGTGRKRREEKKSTQFKAFESIASLFGENTFLKTMNDERTANYVNEKFPFIKVLINEILLGADTKASIQLDSYSGKVFYFNTPTGKSPVHSMSDGFQTIFAWLFDMLIRMLEVYKNIEKPQDIRAIVLMDELDMHLSLTWQRNILPSLEKVFPKIQFVIATQSPFTIQSMKTNDVCLLELENQEVVIKPFFHKGKPWGWTISEIMVRMTHEVTETSVMIDNKLLELNKAVRENDQETIATLTKDIQEALPLGSPYCDYLNRILELKQTVKTQQD